MSKRYFVRVFATNKRALIDLQKLDLDLFQATARQRERQFQIDGLVTLEDVERLVNSGYRVLVEEESTRRARAREVVEFAEWLSAREKAR